MPLFSLNIRRLAETIANAVDLVGVNDTAHGKRVGVMARECARQAGMDEAEQVVLFEAGLLHDCGVSSTRIHRKIVSELDWKGADAHCQRGLLLLEGFPPFAHLAPIIRHHHTHWQDLQAQNLPQAIALHSNLLYLCDRVDMLSGHYYADAAPDFRLAELRRRVAGYSGEYFAPAWVEAFLQVSAEDWFWDKLKPENLGLAMQDIPLPERECVLNLIQLRSFAVLIAQIVDAKSPYTAEHSLGVARLAKFIGVLANFPSETTDKLEIAGLLHDIGKLQIPDEILDKPGKLDADEWQVMKSHSLVTWKILEPLNGIEEIAQWAAFHHEAISGVGYPFQLQGEDLSLEARIIRVADIFQAMAQQRPYRPATPPTDIIALLRKMAETGEVEGLVVEMVAAHLEDCHAVALGVYP
ncbi:MAG: HD-GYP domain-containing protein [Candidatus Methylumidiphilus sp.]